MPTAAELITKIEVHGVDKYSRDMDKADKTTASAAGNMDKAGKSAGGMGAAISGATKALGAIGLAGMGISTVTSAATGLGNALGLGLANQMEQTRAQMMAFYKDGAQVETLLGQVKKEAASTPFAFHEIATAFAQLGPTAKSAGKDTLELTRIAEALAASNPMQGFEGAVFSLKEAVSGDMTSIIERFNLSRSSIKKFRDQGMTDLEAVQAAMAEQGITYDLVAAQAQTMSGRWSTFTDTINEVKMVIATPIFEALKSSLMGMQGGLESALPTLQKFGAIAGEGIAKGIELLGAALTAAGPAIKNFIAADVVPKIQAFAAVLISPVIPAVQQLATVVGSVLGPAMTQVFGFIGQHQEILGGLAVVVGGALVVAFGAWAVAAGAAAVATIAAAAPVIALGAALTLLAAGIIYVVKNWDEITQKFPIAGKIVDEIVVSFRNFAEWIGKAAQAIVDANFGEKIQAAFNWLVDFNLAEKAAEWFGGLWTGMHEKWDEGVSFLTNLGTSIFDAIGDVTSTLWQKGQDVIAGLARGYVELWTSEINFFINLGTTVFGAVGDVLSTLWQKGQDLIAGLYRGVKELWATEVAFYTNLGSTVFNAIGTVVDTLWQKGQDLIAGLYRGIKELWATEVAFFTNLGTAITGAIGSLLTTLYNTGRDLIQGFINGVQSMWDGAVSFVSNLFGEVIGGVKRVLGIASPSTIMQGIGVDFIQGFIDGTGSMAGALKDFVTGLVGNAVSAAREAAGGIVGAIGGAAGDALGAAGGAIGGFLGQGGDGSGGFDIARTTADGRIGYTSNNQQLSEGQVRSIIEQAAGIAGVALSAQDVNTLVARARQESGFNTGAVNLWDVNARNGTPSVGLFQTIAPTFSSNAMGGYGDITNPLHNTIAALRYIQRTYGGPRGLPGLHSGYAAGGTVKPGWFTVGERGFELGHLGPGGLQIFSNEASKALIGTPGGMTGYQGGSNTKAEMFAAAVASPGGWTPALAQAWFEGMEQIAKGMEEETELFRKLLGQAEQQKLGEEMRRFVEWVNSFGEAWLKELLATQGPQAAFQAFHGRSTRSMDAPVTVVLQVDGREFARATAPAISGQMAATVAATMGGT